jgi:hypothetical protein
VARQGLAQVIRQALTDNPMLEEVAPVEDEDAPAGGDHAPRLTASVDDLTAGEELYDSIWQTCVPDGWDANGLPSQASEAPCASEHPISPLEAIVPDVIVTKVGHAIEVVLSEEGIPRLRISATYRRMSREGKLGEPEAKHYLDDKLCSAVWLIRSIEQRRQMLFKVATSLVKIQRDFLDHRLAHLKPLALTEVADAIGLHESTVSRVITNKYLATEHGIVALKDFFHRGMESSGGETRSSLTVTEIPQLIAAEAGTRPQPAWPPGSRLSPDEEQWVHQAIEEQRARRPAWFQDWLHRKGLETWMLAADPEVHAAYRDLRTALAHPQLRPAVLLALQAFAQAAQAGATTSPPADGVKPVQPLQERPHVQAHRRQGDSWIGESPKMREVSRLIERA